MTRSMWIAPFLAFPLVMSVGCKEEARWKSRNYTERSSSNMVSEVPVPKALWEWVIDPERSLLQMIDLKTGPTPDAGGGKSAILKKTVETHLKPMAVYLIEETQGVLGGRNQKINFGPGGGDIDLRDFIVDTKGAFRVVFEFGQDLEPKSPWRAWYLSNAQKRKIGPDLVGAGCNRYMDVSSVIKDGYAKDGLLIAVSGGRAQSALAGTFFFSAKNGSTIEVSRVTFFDSSKRHLQCGAR